MCLLGAAFAIIVVKMVFGGIGNNFVNPALAARAFLLASFPVAMTAWTKTGVNFVSAANLDAVSTATPLSFLKAGPAGLADLAANNISLSDMFLGNTGGCIGENNISLSDMFLGNTGGCIGETCALLVILGGVYLIYKGIISYVMPVAYIVTVFVNISLSDMFLGNTGGCIGETCALLVILGGVYLIYKGIISYVMPVAYIVTVFVLTCLLGGFNLQFAIYQLMAGGLMLGGFFMLTDYATSPMTKKGQVIYAVLDD